MGFGAARESRRGMAWRFDEFEVDAQRNVLRRKGARVPIKPKALETLIYLLQHQSETVSKAELLQAVWAGAMVEDNTVAVTIATLRRALRDKPKDARYVITVPGSGYRFVADAEPRSREASSEPRKSFHNLVPATQVWSLTSDSTQDDWPVPVDPAATVRGKTRGEWLATWMRYIMERPGAGHPLLEQGADLGEAIVVDGVAFLFKPFFETAVTERRCHMQAAVPILVPIRAFNIDNAGAKPGEDLPEAEMLDHLKRVIDDLDDLALDVDGAAVEDIHRFRTGPQRFSFQLGADSFLAAMGLVSPVAIYPSCCDGYVALLPPPPPGQHTVRFGGTGHVNGERLHRETTYHLRVD